MRYCCSIPSYRVLAPNTTIVLLVSLVLFSFVFELSASCIHIYIYICTYLYIHVCIYVLVCMSTCVYIYINRYVHLHICIHMSICIHVPTYTCFMIATCQCYILPCYVWGTFAVVVVLAPNMTDRPGVPIEMLTSPHFCVHLCQSFRRMRPLNKGARSSVPSRGALAFLVGDDCDVYPKYVKSLPLRHSPAILGGCSTYFWVQVRAQAGLEGSGYWAHDLVVQKGLMQRFPETM